MTRILLVEDDVELRTVLSVALGREGWDICAVGNAADAARAVAEFEPLAAVLDIDLGPGPDGLSVARELRARGDIAFLFLTDRSAVEDRLAGFESGADDYLAKPFVLAELVARLRVVLRRASSGTVAVEEVVAIGPLKIDRAGRRVFLDGETVELTHIEFELLANLASQAGRVASKADLLTQVWGFEGYDQNLVEVHVSSLRRKLAAHGSLVQTVRGAGYVLRVD